MDFADESEWRVVEDADPYERRERRRDTRVPPYGTAGGQSRPPLQAGEMAGDREDHAEEDKQIAPETGAICCLFMGVICGGF